MILSNIHQSGSDYTTRVASTSCVSSDSTKRIAPRRWEAASSTAALWVVHRRELRDGGFAWEDGERHPWRVMTRRKIAQECPFTTVFSGESSSPSGPELLPAHCGREFGTSIQPGSMLLQAYHEPPLRAIEFKPYGRFEYVAFLRASIQLTDEQTLCAQWTQRRSFFFYQYLL